MDVRLKKFLRFMQVLVWLQMIIFRPHWHISTLILIHIGILDQIWGIIAPLRANADHREGVNRLRAATESGFKLVRFHQAQSGWALEDGSVRDVPKVKFEEKRLKCGKQMRIDQKELALLFIWEEQMIKRQRALISQLYIVSKKHFMSCNKLSLNLRLVIKKYLCHETRNERSTLQMYVKAKDCVNYNIFNLMSMSLPLNSVNSFLT